MTQVAYATDHKAEVTPHTPTILQAMDITGLFRGATWDPWRVALKAIHGLPITNLAELALYEQCTGRETPPTEPASEAWLICGRRAGKGRIAAMSAVHAAFRGGYNLSPGERGIVLVLATNRAQGQIVLRYIKALISSVPSLAKHVTDERAEAIELDNGITIEVGTTSSKTTRGFTLCGVICDETAFWRDESSFDPGHAVLAALRPGLATTGGQLLAIGSPHRKEGVMYDAHAEHWGKEGSDVLVWNAPSRTMNPSLPQRIVDKAMADDEAVARAEWLAEFRSDLLGFLSRELIEQAKGTGTRKPERGVSYECFVDVAGGTGQDSYAMAIAHIEEDGTVVCDLAVERRPPFSADQVTEEFADIAKAYGCTEVTGDYFGGGWPTERWAANGVTYNRSKRTSSEVFIDSLVLFTSGRASIPSGEENKRLHSQLASLERRTHRGGKDAVAHPRGNFHDDLGVTCCGALLAASDHANDGPVLIDRWTFAPMDNDGWII